MILCKYFRSHLLSPCILHKYGLWLLTTCLWLPKAQSNIPCIGTEVTTANVVWLMEIGNIQRRAEFESTLLAIRTYRANAYIT